jgi:amidohydrolase
MHACGHDGHTVCLLGAALTLADFQDQLAGPVKFIFQPAEEAGNGAERLCKAGVLNDPPVVAIFGLHGWPGLPVGTAAIRSGPFFASCDTFEIKVKGKGAHAAFPHHGIDPIMIGSQIVTALQSIVARRCDPLDSLVVTVAEFHAGTASNIIPPEAILRGTIRALKPETRKKAADLVTSISSSMAEGLGGRAEVVITDDVPPLSNDPKTTGYMREILQKTLGSESVITEFPQVMGVEDFAYYVQQVPGTFWVLGLLPAGKSEMGQLHQPDFDFTDAAVPIGMKLHCLTALEFARCAAR